MVRYLHQLAKKRAHKSGLQLSRSTLEYLTRDDVQPVSLSSIFPAHSYRDSEEDKSSSTDKFSELTAKFHGVYFLKNQFPKTKESLKTVESHLNEGLHYIYKNAEHASYADAFFFDSTQQYIIGIQSKNSEKEGGAKIQAEFKKCVTDVRDPYKTQFLIFFVLALRE